MKSCLVLGRERAKTSSTISSLASEMNKQFYVEGKMEMKESFSFNYFLLLAS